MAQYGTPAYDYSKATSNLTRSKSQSDAMQDYGRFLGQTQFRRQRRNMGQEAERNFPRVQQAYNRRGMLNSGLRREGQQRYMQDYARNLGDLSFDQAAMNQGYDMRRAQGDANYQAALMDLYERFQAQRAQQDPFQAVVF